jgi:hypothetical protein
VPRKKPSVREVRPNPTSSHHQLVRDLDRALGKNRRLALELANWFAGAIGRFPNETRQGDKALDAAARSADVADAIARSAGRLRQILRANEDAIRFASSRGYLPAAIRPSGATSVRDLGLGYWKAACVDHIIDDASAWRQSARLASRRSPGPRVGDRHYLAEWVGIALDRHGIRLTKARGGVFAKVLLVIYEALGLDIIHSFRDVCRVIDDESLWDRIKTERLPKVRIPAKK